MRTLFFAVDLQNDFLLPTGALYVPGSDKIIPNLEKIMQMADQNDIPVVYTMDFHTKNSKEISDTPDFKTTFPKHCIAFETGANLISQIDPHKFSGGCKGILYSGEKIHPSIKWVIKNRQILIFKDALDVFEGNRHTKEIVGGINPDVVFIFGVAGDYCVDYAVSGLVKLGYKAVIIYDAIKSIKEPPYEKWLNLGVTLMPTTMLDQFMRI